jgi:hypothetical protein
MKIAFVHYHLKTGGVTTVLRRQAEAVRDIGDAIVLAGTRPESSFPAPVTLIEGLGYDDPALPPPDPDSVAAAMLDAIAAHFGGPCDLLHVHNPTLAKNAVFLDILKCLRRRGQRLLLQIHDFAEDGRPSAYYRDAQYPRDCHYAVVNTRDYHLLVRAGLQPSGVHTLFNAVTGFGCESTGGPDADRVLYPVRAIRRKNIGEAMLLSLFFKDRDSLAITQPPNSPADLPSYASWQQFADRKRLNVDFEAGIRHAFSDLVRSAKFMITTSITEGFGFSFLEPWLGGKRLWGRKLADICADFEKNGVRLSHLYGALNVPLDSFDTDVFRTTWMAAVRSNAAHFGWQPSPDRVDSGFAALTSGRRVDFGLLNEPLQQQAIEWVLSSPTAADTLIGLNPYLAEPGHLPDADAVIRANRRAVMDRYGPSRSRDRLLAVYRKVIRSDPVQHIDKSVLVAHFMNPANFSLLKWWPYAL